MIRLAALVAGLLAVALVGLNAVAASNEKHGNFQSHVVTDGCTSAVDICTAGTLTGELKGSFEFTATSLVPTADTPTTGVLLYTGDIVVRAKDGTITCKDAGAFESTGDGAVSSVCELVGGTGDFAGATGQIQFVGNFTFEAGGSGDYRAVIEKP